MTATPIPLSVLDLAMVRDGATSAEALAEATDFAIAAERLGYTRIWVVPVATVVMLLVALASGLLLGRTRAGHAMYAVGGNTDAARLSGIRTDRTIVLSHVLCAVAAGLAGLLLAARFSTGVGAQIYSAGYDLESIAAVVLGLSLIHISEPTRPY